MQFYLRQKSKKELENCKGTVKNMAGFLKNCCALRGKWYTKKKSNALPKGRCMGKTGGAGGKSDCM